MANHLPKRREMVKQDGDDLGLYSSDPDSAQTAFNPFSMLSKGRTSKESRKTVLTLQGEEIFFQYGAHSDDTLLAEYGFSLGWQGTAPDRQGNMDNNVDLTERVEKLFASLPTEEATQKQEVLKAWSYWG